MRRIVEEGTVVEAWYIERSCHTGLEHRLGVIHPVGDGASRILSVADLLEAVGELSTLGRGLLGDFVPDAPHDDGGTVAELVDEVHQITLMPLVEV